MSLGSEARAERRSKLDISPADAVSSASSLRQILCGNDAIVHGGRPLGNYGPPHALFHPALARLDFHLRHLGKNLAELEPEPELLNNVHYFMEKSLEVYANAVAREGRLTPLLKMALGMSLLEQNLVYGATNDFVWRANNKYVTIVEQIKSEFALGGDAFLQAALSYSELISDRRYHPRSMKTNHPAILIGLMGDYIEIGRAIYLGGDVYYDETFLQRLSLDFFSHEHILRLAQAFKAVMLARDAKEHYYTRLEAAPPPEDSLAHPFPSPTHLSGDPLPEKLVFRCRLTKSGERYVFPSGIDFRESSVSSGLYIPHMPLPDDPSDPDASEAPSGTSTTALQIEVLVKFTDRYDPLAHRILAAAGFAPRLYSCSRVHGELYMAVMELLPGWTMEHQTKRLGKAVPLSVFDCVRAAIDRLHEEDIVFGDLRPSNVVCTPESVAEPGSAVQTEQLRAKLVDFDWTGVDGEGLYPAVLDDNKQWVAGVEWYGMMRKEHDLGMLEKLRLMCK